MQPPRPLNIYFPGKLVFGKGTLEKLPDELLQLSCKKLLVITIEPLLPKINTLIETLHANLVEVRIDTSIVQEPSFEDLKKFVDKVHHFNPDTILGIGCESILAIAKLTAARLENEQTLPEYVGIGLLRGRKKKLILHAGHVWHRQRSFSERYFG